LINKEVTHVSLIIRFKKAHIVKKTLNFNIFPNFAVFPNPNCKAYVKKMLKKYDAKIFEKLLKKKEKIKKSKFHEFCHLPQK